MQERQWCEDIEVISGFGTRIGLHYRCRRCGRIWQSSHPGTQIGPCLDDAVPNWVGEG